MTDERKPQDEPQVVNLAKALAESLKPLEHVGRRPGPPKSGEVGWYECSDSTARYRRFICEHVKTGWRHDWPMFVVPLHDYPLVPGDTVRKLQAELDEMRKVHQDLVASYERLVNDDTDEREAFEAAREGVLDDCDEWFPSYDTYDDWKAAGGGEMTHRHSDGDGEGK